ncbi:MAG: uroporphyrinogen-III C-methyltransferase [Acidobacteria bacterium]|nr:uroporphyrinogen-III C-methyltransferase [Acidobacteriota bacterium]
MNSKIRKAGTVYLVGAGPGHPGLITRMGYDLLQRCDAVAYDALIPLELVSSLPERVERHYVGRRAGRHSMPQSEKNRLLVDLALRGLNVVRLKGGDTAFFGGTAEEAECLAAAGVRVVVVPGVTAASAVAAASGLPLTDRRGASWVFFATGHGSSAEPTPVPWQEISGLRGGTIVIYMGLANLEEIVKQMLAGGCAAGTPCMIVQGASTGAQRIETSTLIDIVEDCRRKQLKPPALVVVGQVVQHRAYACKPPMPLAGKRILVTCCPQETEAVCAVLRDRGAEPLPYPTYLFEECDDAEGWTRFSSIASSGGWCAFSSAPEVDAFTRALMHHGFDLRSLGKFIIAALGPGVEGELLRIGIRADVAFPFLPQKLALRDLHRGGDSTPANLILISEGMQIDRSEWAEVIELKLRCAKPAAWEPHWTQEVLDNPPDIILFRNPAAVAGFVEILEQETAYSLVVRSNVVVTDEVTAASARRCNLPFVVDTEFLQSLSGGPNCVA